MDEHETVARLTFNTAAAHQYFDSDSQGIRLRIERGVVTFRAMRSVRGADVIAIERRPKKGIFADIKPDAEFAKLLMRRLFRAGLTEDKPYFALAPEPRGWFGVDHLSEPAAPPGQAIMVVSDFEPPPVPVDMALWQKFRRALMNERPIDEGLWTPVRRMIRSAKQITARPQRGRLSQERILATKLVTAVEKNAILIQVWGDRQPEFGNEVVTLFDEIGIIPHELATAAPEATPDTTPLMRRRPRRTAPEPTTEPVENPAQVVAETFIETETEEEIEEDADLDPTEPSAETHVDPLGPSLRQLIEGTDAFAADNVVSETVVADTDPNSSSERTGEEEAEGETPIEAEAEADEAQPEAAEVEEPHDPPTEAVAVDVATAHHDPDEEEDEDRVDEHHEEQPHEEHPPTEPTNE